MDQLINILAYVSLISGGLLIVLMLMSVLGGLDLDFDFGDTDVDAGGLGVVKSVLTFVSVSAWVGKIVISTTQNTAAAIGAAILAGAVSVLILSMLLRLLLKNQKFVHWTADMAVGKSGKAYLRIPANGSGIVHVMIEESKRELKAKTNGKDIPTGADVFIEDYQDGYLIVSELDKY